MYHKSEYIRYSYSQHTCYILKYINGIYLNRYYDLVLNMVSGIGIYLQELTDNIFRDRKKYAAEEIEERKWRKKTFKDRAVYSHF